MSKTEAPQRIGDDAVNAQGKERFRDLLYWLHAYAGAGEETLLGVGLYAAGMIWNLDAWYVGSQVARVLRYRSHADYSLTYGNGARGMYNLACAIRGKHGICWVDAIAIARIVRDHETGPEAGDLAAWESRYKAEAECIVALMERDGIDPAHIEEVRRRIL